jgi:hypothetical protein
MLFEEGSKYKTARTIDKIRKTSFLKIAGRDYLPEQ